MLSRRLVLGAFGACLLVLTAFAVPVYAQPSSNPNPGDAGAGPAAPSIEEPPTTAAPTTAAPTTTTAPPAATGTITTPPTVRPTTTTTPRQPQQEPRPPTIPIPPNKDKDDDSNIDYVTPRTEPAGFPLVGGNSDIGLQFGVAGRLTRFANNVQPFVFRADLLLTASIRDSGGKLGLAQQEYSMQFDIPNLLGGRVRTTPGIHFLNFVDAGYFGRGNASTSTPPPNDQIAGNPERYFQHTARELRIRDFTRIRIKKPLDFMIAPIVRYHDHQSYPGSKLATDAQQGVARGLRPVLITSLAIGIVIDSRDNEFFPRSGMYHQIGERLEQGYPIGGDVQMASTGAMLAGYYHLGGPFVAAARLVLDFQYGKIPYYDLYNAGPFNEWEMPGGANGIRGVPWGRYSAPIKTILNTELRALWFKFRLLGERFRLGNDIFFDTGRVFDGYSFNQPRDGKGVGLKWGAGAGIYLVWGEAAIFRIEAAYSPDAVEANPRFPLGLYLAEGVMF